MGQNWDDFDDEHGSGVATKEIVRTRTPNMYRVVLLNDDYTPMEFVIEVLQKFFKKDKTEATEIMLAVHNKGKGVCGVYSFEVAETKVSQVMSAAGKAGHPLQCAMEKE